MRFLINVVVVLHLIGAAAIIGGWLANPRVWVPRLSMLYGARAQIATGLVLVALDYANATPPNNAKIAVKLVIALAVVACLEVASGRQRRALASQAPATARATGPGVPAGATQVSARLVAPGVTRLTQVAVVLTIVNVCVAVLWR